MTELQSLISPLTVLYRQGAAPVQVQHCVSDSRQVTPGDLFVALPGYHADGHDYAAEAVNRGAVALITERLLSLPAGAAQYVVANSWQALALIARQLYGCPDLGLQLVGVTGTNGKTTVTYLVEQLLREAGVTVGLIGTVENRLGEEVWPAAYTTPDARELFRLLAEFRQRGAQAVVMEVSSHALEQWRIAGLTFDVGILTNITPEHLDYHGSMRAYTGAKARLWQQSRHWLVNGMDERARQFADWPHSCACGREPGPWWVGIKQAKLTPAGLAATFSTPGGDLEVTSPLVGAYNLENICCAVAAGVLLGVPLATIAAGLKDAWGAPGRLQAVSNSCGARILVDFAHTADALTRVLQSLHQLQPQRLLVVFGCGGDRDTGKRPLMGQAAAAYADVVIVTSDNPRSEDPQRIIADILPGIKRQGSCNPLTLEQVRSPEATGYVSLADRRQALQLAVEILQPGDLLLVAGKGHETYQEIQGYRYPFVDSEVLQQALAAWSKG